MDSYDTNARINKLVNKLLVTITQTRVQFVSSNHASIRTLLLTSLQWVEDLLRELLLCTSSTTKCVYVFQLRNFTLKMTVKVKHFSQSSSGRRSSRSAFLVKVGVRRYCYSNSKTSKHIILQLHCASVSPTRTMCPRPQHR